MAGTGRRRADDERAAAGSTPPAAAPEVAQHPGEAHAPAGVRSHADADFAAYMQARQPSLLRTAYLLTGDRPAAEDLVQTAFAQLYLAWDRVRDREALDGYVRRILVNEHRSAWRRAWRRLERSTAAVPEPEPHTDAYDEGTGAALWAAVRSLPPKQRSVVVLRYYEDLGEREIADLLGIAPGTVKSQASRALATLRDRAPGALRAHLDPDGPVTPGDPADPTDPTAVHDDPARGREEDR